MGLLSALVVFAEPALFPAQEGQAGLVLLLVAVLARHLQAQAIQVDQLPAP